MCPKLLESKKSVSTTLSNIVAQEAQVLSLEVLKQSTIHFWKKFFPDWSSVQVGCSFNNPAAPRDFHQNPCKMYKKINFSEFSSLKMLQWTHKMQFSQPRRNFLLKFASVLREVLNLINFCFFGVKVASFSVRTIRMHFWSHCWMFFAQTPNGLYMRNFVPENSTGNFVCKVPTQKQKKSYNLKKLFAKKNFRVISLVQLNAVLTKLSNVLFNFSLVFCGKRSEKPIYT